MATIVYALAVLTAVIAQSNDDSPGPGSRLAASVTPYQNTASGTHQILPLAIPAPQPQRSPAPAPQNRWLNVIISDGDTISSIFSRLEMHSKLREVLALGNAAKALTSIRPGQALDIRLSDNGLEELIYAPNIDQFLHIERDGKTLTAKMVDRPIEVRRGLASGRIKHSLFGAAQKAGMSESLTMELAGIFGWDIDFALDIREGDNFTMIFEEHYREGDKLRDGNILAAEFVNQGKVFRALRYENANGETEYYAPDGRSMRKPFLRTPVNFTRISSRFDPKRKHPILNKIRAHKGVDYAAPKGTPIKASGDGKVKFRGNRNGYGKTIIIQHGSKYSTLYGHMSRFAKGTKKGRRVKQGQVIGYIGSTGLATGPHLHYEFRVSGVHRNPLTVKLPGAESLPANEISRFATAVKPLRTQLDTYKRALLAMKPHH
ncbi:MAG: peptidoglycan DD-metalloendopeptidase family protein [Gammaproteobacteria bacterium]